MAGDAPKEAEEKKINKEEETLKRNPGPSAEAMVYTPLKKKSLEVLTVSSNTEEYPTLLEELVDRVVEGVTRNATE